MDNHESDSKSSSECSSEFCSELESQEFDSELIYDENFDSEFINDEFDSTVKTLLPLHLSKLIQPLKSIVHRIDVLPTSDLKMYVPIDEEECVDMLLDNKIKREDVFICEQSTENEETENCYLSLCHCDKEKAEEPVLALPLNIKMAKLKNARKNVENYRVVGAGGPCLKKIYCEPELKPKLSTTDCILSLHKIPDNDLRSLQCFSRDSALRAVDAPFIRACLANRSFWDRKPISLYSIKPTEEMKLSNVPRSLRIANAELLGEALRNQNLYGSSDSDEHLTASDFQENLNAELEQPTLSGDNFTETSSRLENPYDELGQQSRFSLDAEDKFTRPSRFSQASKNELNTPTRSQTISSTTQYQFIRPPKYSQALTSDLKRASRFSEAAQHKDISRFATGAQDELTRPSKYMQSRYKESMSTQTSRISRAAHDQDQNLTRPSRFSTAPNAEFGQPSRFSRAAHYDYHNQPQDLTRPSRFSQAPNANLGPSRRFSEATQDPELTRPSRFSKGPNAEFVRSRMSRFSNAPNTELSRASRFVQISQDNLPTRSSSTQALNDRLTGPSSRFSQAPNAEFGRSRMSRFSYAPTNTELSRASRFVQPSQDSLPIRSPSTQALNDRLSRPSSRFSQAPNAERRGTEISRLSRTNKKSRYSSIKTFLIPKRISSLHNLLEDKKVQITPQHVLLTRALLPEYLCDNNDQIIYLTPAKILQLLNDLKILVQNNECINDSGQFILEAIAYPYKDEKSWTRQEMPPRIKRLIKALIKNRPLKTAELALGKYLVGNHIFSGRVPVSKVKEEFEKFSNALTSCTPLSRHHYNMALTLGIIPSLLDECSKNKEEKEIRNKRNTTSVNLLTEIKSSMALSSVDLGKFLDLRRTLSNNDKINTKISNTNNIDESTTEEKSSTSSKFSSIVGKLSDVHRTYGGGLSTQGKPLMVGLPLTTSTGKLTTAGNFTRIKSSNGNINTSADTKNKPLSGEISDENKATVLYVNRFAALHISRPKTIEQYDYFKWLEDKNNSILNFKQPNQIPNRFAITQKSFKEITNPYLLKNNGLCDFAKTCKYSLQQSRLVRQRLNSMKRFYEC